MSPWPPGWRGRVLQIGAALAALACAGVLVAYLVGGEVNLHDSAHSGFMGDCDNMLGKCLRGRQIRAQEGLFLILGLTALASGWQGVRIMRGKPLTRRGILIVVVSVIVLVAFAVVRPDVHLDQRYGGWLGD